jgi:tetratricopeptide (TPR) repeat protein
MCEKFYTLSDQARYHKMQNEFDQALGTVNAVLEQDPEFPDALFLKAQILGDGFGNSAAAKRYLKKVMKAVPNKDETIHRWASTYYDELTGMERGKQTHFSPNEN